MLTDGREQTGVHTESEKSVPESCARGIEKSEFPDAEKVCAKNVTGFRNFYEG